MSKTPKTAPTVKKLTDVDSKDFYRVWNETVQEDGSGSISDVVEALGITVTDESRAKIQQAMSQRASNLRKDFKACELATASKMTLFSPKGRGRQKGAVTLTLVQSILADAKKADAEAKA